MKIGQNPDIANALSQAAAKQQAKTPAPAAEAAAKSVATQAAGVPVTFSNAARSADRSSADFDAGKVKAVRAAIDKGTFTIDAEAIADKLLSNAEETLSRARD